MLVIEDNSVYEIDEECLRTRKVPKECHTMEKLYGKPKESRAKEQERRK